MENKKIKCSNKDDAEIDAIIFCGACRIYMCNKCEKHHSKLFSTHQVYNLEGQKNDIFTGYCKEPNHLNKLEYFCKDHNTLCCISCISKMVKNGVGLHKDCNICFIEDIIEEKKEKINSNIEYLEEISEVLKDNFGNLNKLSQTITSKKEDLKLNIQKLFTKIRNELNNREDELLLEADKQFDNLYNDKTFEQYKNIQNKIKQSLEKSKNIKFNKDNLVSYINECINIENNIKNINQVNEDFKKCQSDNGDNIKVVYDDKLNSIFENIKLLGKILVFHKDNNLDSVILNNDLNSKELIYNWIKEKINKDLIKFEKIFTMTKNGSSCKDFHNYCDNKGPTLTLVKTTKKKIFGGFTPLNWENKPGFYKYDLNDETFIFSINLMKKYNLINKEKGAIYCNSENGPNFGGRDFCIDKNMRKGDSYANKNSNFLSDNNLELIDEKGDNKKFDVEEFEVFKVIY